MSRFPSSRGRATLVLTVSPVSLRAVLMRQAFAFRYLAVKPSENPASAADPLPSRPGFPGYPANKRKFPGVAKHPAPRLPELRCDLVGIRRAVVSPAGAGLLATCAPVQSPPPAPRPRARRARRPPGSVAPPACAPADRRRIRMRAISSSVGTAARRCSVAGSISSIRERRPEHVERAIEYGRPLRPRVNRPARTWRRQRFEQYQNHRRDFRNAHAWRRGRERDARLFGDPGAGASDICLRRRAARAAPFVARTGSAITRLSAESLIAARIFHRLVAPIARPRRSRDKIGPSVLVGPRRFPASSRPITKALAAPRILDRLAACLASRDDCRRLQKRRRVG